MSRLLIPKNFEGDMDRFVRDLEIRLDQVPVGDDGGGDQQIYLSTSNLDLMYDTTTLGVQRTLTSSNSGSISVFSHAPPDFNRDWPIQTLPTTLLNDTQIRINIRGSWRVVFWRTGVFSSYNFSKTITWSQFNSLTPSNADNNYFDRLGLIELGTVSATNTDRNNNSYTGFVTGYLKKLSANTFRFAFDGSPATGNLFIIGPSSTVSFIEPIQSANDFANLNTTQHMIPTMDDKLIALEFYVDGKLRSFYISSYDRLRSLTPQSAGTAISTLDKTTALFIPITNTNHFVAWSIDASNNILVGIDGWTNSLYPHNELDFDMREITISSQLEIPTS